MEEENSYNSHKTPNLSESTLSLEDQEWIKKNLSLTESENNKTKANAYVSRSVNDTYKLQENAEKTLIKRKAIAALQLCNYRTPPKELAGLLKVLFQDYQSREGHWLYVAQNWSPRTINSVISLIIKRHNRGEVTIQNPAAYFTALIKYRKKRRNLTAINGTRKQQ